MGQISAVWEGMKRVLFSWTTVANKGKTAAKPRETTVTAGAESILYLLIAPEMEVLTLQIEQEARKNVLLW